MYTKLSLLTLEELPANLHKKNKHKTTRSKRESKGKERDGDNKPANLILNLGLKTIRSRFEEEKGPVLANLFLVRIRGGPTPIGGVARATV